MSNEFYVGYKKHAPRSTAKRIRMTVIPLIPLLAISVAIMARMQAPVHSGKAELESYEFDGVLRESPLPHVLVQQQDGTAKAYILVGAMKYGLPEFARAGIGKHVQFRGSLIYRQNMTMVEMNDPDSFQVVGEVTESIVDDIQSLGAVTLTGEFVDTKCFFGTMRPGVGKVHRACAIVCLKGGTPPGILLRQNDGRSTVVMLAGTDGDPLPVDIEWAARQISASGSLEVHNDIPILMTSGITLVD